MQYIKIPEERVGVLVGKEGFEKREIEKRTKTKIIVNKGEVSVEGDPFDEWVAKDVVKAIGRGFAPEKAIKLLNEGYALETLLLRDFANTEKSLQRKKGRVIGERGKTRKNIEEMTNTYVSIYGKTISIIGTYEDVALAKEAIIKLLEGSSHTSAYKFMERSVASLKGIPKI